MDSKLEQFVSVTGAPYDAARGLLEACGGNLELAINMHMEGGTSSSSASGPSMYHSPVSNVGPSSQGQSSSKGESSDNGMLSPTSYIAKHGVRAPIPQTAGVLIEDDAPQRRTRQSRRLPQTVFDPFQDYSSTGNYTGSGNQSKKKNLAELFKPPHDIMFHGTFHEAKLAGHHHKKWLLVNIQDSKEFSSQVLNRDIWSNCNVKDIIRQHFIFWQIHSITDDGLKFKHLYHVNSFPYIAVIDPVTGEKMSDWGALSLSGFMEVITEFLANHPFDSNVECDNQETDGVAVKSEQSQLEAAIQASLRDVEKSIKKTSAAQLVFSDDSDVDCVSLISSDSDMEQGEVEFTGNSVGGTSTTTRLIYPGESTQTCNNTIQRDLVSKDSASRSNGCIDLSHEKGTIVKGRGSRKRYTQRDDSDEVAEELPRKMMRADISESFQSSQAPRATEYLESINNHLATNSGSNYKSDNTAELSFILFRLPDGSRLKKEFVSTNPIKELFDFLLSRGYSGSEHEVVTQFPRRNLCEIDHSISFKDLGLYPRETVFVHTVE